MSLSNLIKAFGRTVLNQFGPPTRVKIDSCKFGSVLEKDQGTFGPRKGYSVEIFADRQLKEEFRNPDDIPRWCLKVKLTEVEYNHFVGGPDDTEPHDYKIIGSTPIEENLIENIPQAHLERIKNVWLNNRTFGALQEQCINIGKYRHDGFEKIAKTLEHAKWFRESIAPYAGRNKKPDIGEP